MDLGLCPPRKGGEFAVVRCASTHVLTLHPQEKTGKEGTSMDSHRRLGLLAQFQAAKLTLVGLQETKCRRPRAKDTRPYRVFSSAAGPRGQSGIKLWVLKDWLQSTTTQLVVYTDHRLLLVSLHTQVGPVQVAGLTRHCKLL